MTWRLWHFVPAVLTTAAVFEQRHGANLRLMAGNAMFILACWVPSSVGPLMASVLTGSAMIMAMIGFQPRPRPGHGEPWRQVMTLGRGGPGPVFIARLGGLPAESIQVMVAPIAVDRTSFGGKIFRHDGREPPRKSEPERPGSSS